MKFLKHLLVLTLVASLGGFLAPLAKAQETVQVEDIHGTQEVAKNPKVVVALDNRTFQTLEEWGIPLAAVPKDVMPADSAYVKDDQVENIGNHREPNLELIAALQPDLVIVGQRFASHYDAIKELVPDATVLDFSWDVSEEAEEAGENLTQGLIKGSKDLGAIFGKEKEADQLVADFESAIQEAKNAYNGKDKVMSLVVSGGEIGFAAPHSGRVWGPLYDILGLQPALEVDHASSDHKGDDISVEAIAESDPDWLFVLDRDAAVADEASSPAKDVIDQAPALAETKAIKEGHVLYAPDDTYTNESIQTFTTIFQEIAKAFAK
ncbi:siderophore ABC transporter substrate-binding protein [Hutsoniella sourekii]|uniref:siderophore ABC transporter substrate-binding protein n=1 Tax=Hutsoniella sourekii TaxID=87650 RepID=UPI0004B30DA7|nr:siderophore ABC transporter substrate-binding protein [Hutsoniella sourekii]